MAPIYHRNTIHIESGHTGKQLMYFCDVCDMDDVMCTVEYCFEPLIRGNKYCRLVMTFSQNNNACARIFDVPLIIHPSIVNHLGESSCRRREVSA